MKTKTYYRVEITTQMGVERMIFDTASKPTKQLIYRIIREGYQSLVIEPYLKNTGRLPSAPGMPNAKNVSEVVQHAKYAFTDLVEDVLTVDSMVAGSLIGKLTIKRRQLLS